MKRSSQIKLQTKQIKKRNISYRKRLSFIQNTQNRNLYSLICNLKQEIFQKNNHINVCEKNQNNQKHLQKMVFTQIKYQQDLIHDQIDLIKPNFSQKKQLFVFVKKQEEQKDPYPELLKRLLTEFYNRAQKLKIKVKRSKNLPQNLVFVSQKVHPCPYCPKKFERPCSLGGHISKLHSQQKKMQKQALKIKNFNKQP